ncbi:DUF6325 family protein [Blastococcus sp. SYSU D00669]
MTRQLIDQPPDALDELGPVDRTVLEFPGSRFNGEIAPALTDLVSRGTVRILDLLLIRKGADDAVDLAELAELDEGEVGELRAYEGQLAVLLSEEDVAAAAAAVEPGSTAVLLVWENAWAAPFASAVRHAGGSSWPAGASPCRPCSPPSRSSTPSSGTTAPTTTPRGRTTDMPLAARRMRRATVIGPAPVARTAATLGTAAVVAHGVVRRTERREERREDRRDRRW